MSGSEERMQVAFEELQDLKGVWSELRKIWEQIDEMKEKPWLSVQPRKLRQQIDNLLSQMKELPSRLRQYASFEHGFTGIGLAQLVGRRKELCRVVKSAAAAVCARHHSSVVRRTLFRCPPQLCRFFFRTTAVLHSSRPTSSPFIIVDRRSFFLHFQRLHPSRLTSGPYASSLYSFSSAQCYSGCDLLLVDCKYTRVLSFGRRHIDRS